LIDVINDTPPTGADANAVEANARPNHFQRLHAPRHREEFASAREGAHANGEMVG